MTLAAGTRLGSFEVEEPIGSGGMGEVYRARDLKLGRAVAIKVLPEQLHDDDAVRARFEREARAVAALSHPNILAIHHLGDSDGRFYAVTELLQGQTLGERLKQGALPPQKLLRIGRAIAEGLSAAHAQGVIHRDLKPDNIFLTNDGRVKILDFGLARRYEDESEDADPTSPTRPGVVLGTAGYLSPEQVRAEALDERSDVFALGCLLYEMLTGHPAFLRASTVESVVAVLQEDPPPFPTDSPADLCQLIQSCLEKNRAERLQKAHDVALFLDAVAARTRDSRPLSGVQAELLPEPKPRRRERLPWLVAAVLVPLALLAGFLLRPAPPSPPELRYLTHSGRDRSPATSPDGRLVAFTSERDGKPRIWLEQVPGGDETPLTDGPDDFPRFSPDGGAILFARTEGLTSSLFRVPTLGGEPRRVVDDATDGDFSPDGSRIAFVRWHNNGGRMDSLIGIAHADGSAPQQLALLPGRTLFHPRFSPDGDSIAVVESGESPRMTLMVLDAQDGRARELSGWSPIGVLSAPAWSKSGKSLVVAVSGTLAARQGGSTRVLEVPSRGGAPRVLFWNPALDGVLDRLGDDGMVIEARTPRTELVEVGLMAGQGAGRLTHGNSNDRQPTYSPDGRRVVFSSNRSGNLDLWALELVTGSVRRLTDHPGDDWDPAVSPDGRILWSSNRSGHFEVWTAEPDGARPRQLTNDGFLAENPTATRDGQWIVYNSRQPEHPGVWRMRPDGTDPELLVPGNTRLPEVSPDGKYVLYLTDIRLDRLSVRVAKLDGSGVLPFVISLPSEGGRVRWMPDGAGIAFTAPTANGRLAVHVQPFVTHGDTSAQRHLLPGQDPDRSANSFGFSPDGTRLCIALGDEVSHLMVARGVAIR
ncbi:MAG TPA: protein kinase [Thermoanaerobaculia bacterium]|nr:protein kinase [Thermoanaerobaculia bacterium]